MPFSRPGKSEANGILGQIMGEWHLGGEKNIIGGNGIWGQNLGKFGINTQGT